LEGIAIASSAYNACAVKAAALALALASFFLSSFALEAFDEAAKALPSPDENVLIVHSYHHGFVWTDMEEAGIREAFKTLRPQSNLFVECLDWKRFPDRSGLGRIERILLSKYSGREPKLIIATDNAAFDFVFELRKDLCPSAPIVFCGVESFTPETLKDRPDATGVAEKIDPEGTLSLAVRLQPEAKRIFVIQDDTSNAPIFNRIAEGAAKVCPKLQVERSGGLPPEELLAKLDALDPADIIVIANYSRCSDGRIFDHDEALKLVHASAKSPVYGVWSFFFGKGIVGGSLLDGRKHGAKAARMAIRILSGEKASEIPVDCKLDTERLIDYREMLRFKLPFDAVPPDYKVEFAPASAYNDHKEIFWTFIVILGIQAATIFALAVNVGMRKAAERRLMRQNSIVEAMIKNMPFDFWARDKKDKVVLQSEESLRKWGDQRGQDSSGSNNPAVWRENNAKALSGTIIDGEVEYPEEKGELKCYRNIVAPVHCDGEIVGTLGMNIDISHRRKAERELMEREESLNAILNSIGDGLIAADRDGKILRINPMAELMTGFKAQEAIGLDIKGVLAIEDAETGVRIEDPIGRILSCSEDGSLGSHLVLRSKDGKERRVSDRGGLIRDKATGRVSGVVVALRDVTKEHSLHEQLRHSKKMETVGQLAGGVAHDFNNMLSAIMGSAEMLSVKIGDDPKLAKYAKIIIEAGNRAAGLVRKLLDFSRKGKVESAPLDAHPCVGLTVALLERGIDKRIRIETALDAKDSVISGDLIQLQNSLLNLGLNARDAMPDGGVLRFSTANVELGPDACSEGPLMEGAKPGRYIEISVSDSGVGMTQKVMDKIFEPFFTTKKVGEGTGLGLAAVYGCVRDHGGGIRVSSSPGKGSTFKILLPLAESQILVSKAPLASRRGSGLVLIVDDEPGIQSSAHAMLSELGYDVLIAKGGLLAIEIFKDHPEIDLVLLDMVMPDMSGKEAFLAMRKLRPDAKILLCSGFAKNDIVSELMKLGAKGFLQKPCSMAELSEWIGKAMS